MGGHTPHTYTKSKQPSKYMHSVERVLCDKCGSPTNMTNMSMNYLKAPSERLQSAPAHRGRGTGDDARDRDDRVDS